MASGSNPIMSSELDKPHAATETTEPIVVSSTGDKLDTEEATESSGSDDAEASKGDRKDAVHGKKSAKRESTGKERIAEVVSPEPVEIHQTNIPRIVSATLSERIRFRRNIAKVKRQK